MAVSTLPFEKPIQELENRLRALKDKGASVRNAAHIERLTRELSALRRDIYSRLTPWDRVRLARHPNRPYTRDYIRMMTTSFVELHGDRLFKDDGAMVGGFARLDGRKVMLIGTQKGRDTKSNVACRFGCACPEGYRKALRLMKTAAKFHLPVVTLIDTPGAFPGIESEERHVAEAIAVNLKEMFQLPVPVVACVIGEGGSGGALGIGVGDRVLIMENAYYSVISPEGCAAILWDDRTFADRAAAALRITAKDLVELKLADAVIPEPEGGAHTDPERAADSLKMAVLQALDEVQSLPVDTRLKARYDKFRAMGAFGL